MPLKVKQRGDKWVAFGRVELDGRAITRYYHNRSTGSSSEAGAIEWCQAETARQKRRYLLGDEAERITFAMAVMEYAAKPKEADYLAFVLKARPELGEKPIEQFSGRFLKSLGLELKPDCSTDTIMRQVVTPIRSVINHMHELGKGPYLKVKDFTETERINRDNERGKQSRKPKTPGSKEWIEAFCTHADPYNAAMARFMFETAARIDQAVSLTPRDLDLMNRRVRLKAQKGHAEQWVEISQQMMVELANLPPKQPMNRKEGYRLEQRVFGYASRSGYRKRWQTICKEAGIEYLSAHAAGRHGFGTELFIRQGVDAVTVAKTGRWASPDLVLSTYAHSEAEEAEIRERFRTKPEQSIGQNQPKQLKKRG